jgi:hypothetical protein
VDAREAGRQAFQALLANCPYPDGRTREAREWREGLLAEAGMVPAEEGQGVFVAVTSGAVHTDRGDMILVKGITRVGADHPILKTHPQLFERAVPHRLYDTEQMTAGPGERRTR